MSGLHGKNAVVKLGTLATPATVVVLSGVDSVSFGHQADTAEVTAFGDTNKTYVVGLPDATFSMSGNVTDSLRTQLFALSGTEVTPAAEISPEGTTTGKPKYSGTFYVSGYQESIPIGGAITWTANLVPTTAVTLGTNP